MLNLDKPIPMTRREAKMFRKMVYGFIHQDIQTARIAVSGSYDDLLLARLDRIENWAYAAVNESYQGSNQKWKAVS